jgi:Zn-dependent protease
LILHNFDPLTIILATIAFIFAIACHEANHAFVATALGDDTPRLAGRLTLNPMRHISPLGILTFVLMGFGWGWTPVSPWKLRPNPRLGSAMVAAAGPLANLALALVLTVPLRLGVGLSPELHRFLVLAIVLNLTLFVFNLLPIPPLDGFSFLVGVLPQGPANALKQLERYGVGILMALLILPSFIGINIIGAVVDPLLALSGRLLGLQGLFR